jgi:tetratricopeptide (TPR) repeat protein
MVIKVGHMRLSWTVLVLLVIVSACAGRKSKPTSYDMFDNLTSRYNIIFHSKELIQKVSNEQRAGHKEAFEQQLPVLVEPPSLVNSTHLKLLDSVASKSRKLIDTKTKSKYHVDAYFLLGKANYLKGDFHSAFGYFDYVDQNFKDFKRKRQQASIWKIRALMQLGSLEEAGKALDSLFVNLDTKGEDIDLAFASQARYYIHLGDIKSATLLLQQAIKVTSSRQDRLRWHYLLGQLWKQQQLWKESAASFQKVIRSNASHELAFHAQLEQLSIQQALGLGIEDQIGFLRKRLKEDKNRDFREQLHYQLAQRFISLQKEDEAVHHLELAVKEGKYPHHQTKVYSLLAEMYLLKGKYEEAKSAYQQAGVVAPADYPDLSLVQRQAAYMEQIIDDLAIVAFRDSIGHLNALSPLERELLVNQWASEAYENDQLYSKKQKGRYVQGQSGTSSYLYEKVQSGFGEADQRFYFNNPDAMAMGLSQFRQRWGERILADNWRWNQQSSLGLPAQSAPTDSKSSVVESGTKSKKDWEQFYVERYIKPLSEEDDQHEQWEKEVYDAMVRVADTYREQIGVQEKAIAAYQKIVRRFRIGEHHDRIYYHLFVLTGSGDTPTSKEYKELLKQEFPDTDFAKIANDPQYLTRIVKQKKEFNTFYDQLFELFEQGAYESVIREVDQVDTTVFVGDQTYSQLAYLRALSIGYEQPVSAFKQALEEIVQLYPTDSLVTPLVLQQLNYVDQHNEEFASREVALLNPITSDRRIGEDPVQTQWPTLVIQRDPSEAIARMAGNQVQGSSRVLSVQGSNDIQRNTQLQNRNLINAQVQFDNMQNRDLLLLPDSATYYFVIHVTNAQLNLAPSRFGIGQFNRGQFEQANLSHHLQQVNAESQLISIRSFASFRDVKNYENMLLPLLSSIMKIDVDSYETFITTEVNFGTLSDFESINAYISRLQAQ